VVSIASATGKSEDWLFNGEQAMSGGTKRITTARILARPYLFFWNCDGD